MTYLKRISGLIPLLVLPQAAMAERTPQEICEKLIESEPSGQIEMVECVCTYNVANAVLDDDIKALLFESWYTGENVTDRLNALPNPKRVKKQFSKMERTMKVNC